jgi:hypothetical protein
MPSSEDHDSLQRKIATVQAHHADHLMRKKNVVGLAVGLCRRRGQLFDEPCLVVLVTHKVPEHELDPDDVVPREIDGVQTDVQETGHISAQ